MLIPIFGYQFETDIIDDMIQFENSIIFNSEKQVFHDTNCLYFKTISNKLSLDEC